MSKEREIAEVLGAVVSAFAEFRIRAPIEWSNEERAAYQAAYDLCCSLQSAPKPAPQSESEAAQPDRIHELLDAWNCLFFDDEGHVDHASWKRLEDAFAAICATLCDPDEYSALRQIVESWDACDATVNIPPFDGSSALFEAVGVARLIINSTPEPATQSEPEAVRLLKAISKAWVDDIDDGGEPSRTENAIASVHTFLSRPPGPDWRTLYGSLMAAVTRHINADSLVRALTGEQQGELPEERDIDSLNRAQHEAVAAHDALLELVNNRRDALASEAAAAGKGGE